MLDIEAYTDGACSGNPGIGGWGVVLLAKKNGVAIDRREIAGGELNSTNNQMELRAAIEALKALKRQTEITLITDSVYVKKGILEWVPNWKKNNWKTSTKKPVKNRDLWQELDTLASANIVTWKWVKGHSGILENERADTLATDEVKKIKNNQR